MICHCLDPTAAFVFMFVILAVGGVILAWLWQRP